MEAIIQSWRAESPRSLVEQPCVSFAMQALVEWTLLVFAAITGLCATWLIVGGVVGRRASSGRCCPRCAYDMHAIEGRTCPECGLTAAAEQLLRPRRRSWRRAALGVVLLSLAMPAFGMYHFARDMGWTSVVPETIWIVAAGHTSSELPMVEMGLDGFTFADPSTDLWSWQRSLLASSMRRRTNLDEEVSRHRAVLAWAWLIERQRPPTAADAEVIERLLQDPSPRIRELALLLLTERLEAPELDPRIRAVLDAPPGDGAVESGRVAAFLGVCFRYLGSPPEPPDPRIVKIVADALANRPTMHTAAARAARMLADRGLRRPELVDPLLQTAETAAGSSAGTAGNALHAAWLHADEAQRPRVAAALGALAPRIAPGFRDHLALWAVREAAIPEAARAAMLESALASGDRHDVDAALGALQGLSEAELAVLERVVREGIARNQRRGPAEADVRWSELERRLDARRCVPSLPAPPQP